VSENFWRFAFWDERWNRDCGWSWKSDSGFWVQE